MPAPQVERLLAERQEHVEHKLEPDKGVRRHERELCTVRPLEAPVKHQDQRDERGYREYVGRIVRELKLPVTAGPARTFAELQRAVEEDSRDADVWAELGRQYLDRIKLFTGLHRFLPTLLKLEGARVAQLPVNHRPRTRGTAKYHLANRLVGPLLDLLAVRWMQGRHLSYRTQELP